MIGHISPYQARFLGGIIDTVNTLIVSHFPTKLILEMTTRKHCFLSQWFLSFNKLSFVVCCFFWLFFLFYFFFSRVMTLLHEYI